MSGDAPLGTLLALLLKRKDGFSIESNRRQI